MLPKIYAAAGLTKSEVLRMPHYINGELDDFYDDSAYDKLYEYFAFETGEMPYGTRKARDEDPDTWILEHLAGLEA